MSVDSACGPVSESPPASCRHGEAPNGLSGSWSALNHRTHPPCQPSVSRTWSIQARVASTNRSVKKTTDATPASVAAASRVRAAPVGRDRLVEKEVAAGGRCLEGELGLDRGGNRERHRLDVGQQRRVVVVP